MYIVFLVSLNDCYFKTDEKANKVTNYEVKKRNCIGVGNVLTPFF